MSLDVYLIDASQAVFVPEGDKSRDIFIREDGQTKELTVDEWNERYPGRRIETTSESALKELYWRNITHNLAKMAKEAEIYKEVWRPDENGIDRAIQLIIPLTRGIRTLKADPERFRKLEPSNGWGNYSALVAFLEDYLAACKRYPEAEIRVSR